MLSLWETPAERRGAGGRDTEPGWYGSNHDSNTADHKPEQSRAVVRAAYAQAYEMM